MAVFDKAQFKAQIDAQMLVLKPDCNPREYIEDLFKASIAEALIAFIVDQQKMTIDEAFFNAAVDELISCFRDCDFGPNQLSVEAYEGLSQKVMQEIAANAMSQQGVDVQSTDSQGYVRSDGGLYVPPHSLR